MEERGEAGEVEKDHIKHVEPPLMAQKSIYAPHYASSWTYSFYNKSHCIIPQLSLMVMWLPMDIYIDGSKILLALVDLCVLSTFLHCLPHMVGYMV